MLDVAGSVVQKTVSSLTHVINNHGNAPAIETIKYEDFKNVENVDDDKLIDQLYYNYNHGLAGQYIGDNIIKLYKKDDPKKQSVWNTDTNRLTYLLKNVLYNNESKWTVDKKGVETINYLISPVLNKIKIMSKKFHTKNCFDFVNNSPDKIFFINDAHVNLTSDIDDKELHTEVLKYISSHFYLNNKVAIDIE